jgi:hypothetical protein
MAFLLVGAPTGLRAQAPVLAGTAFVGDSVMSNGTVVLHHIADGIQGDLDSMRVGGDGAFRFALPGTPDPAQGDIYFATVRHHGVLYFGPAITAGVQLDTTYVINAWDTLLAPAEGFPVALQSRSVFFEPDSVGWRVTDLLQLRNDEPRTIVGREGGIVWDHPLPAEATNVVTGEGEIALGAAEFENGSLVVRAALPPGERIFVVRYQVESPFLSLPVRAPAEVLDVLVREPAPPVEVDGLELIDRIELEAGSTYLRFSATDVVAASVEIRGGEDVAPPRVEWAALVLALVLAGSGLLVLRRGQSARVTVSAPDREALLFEIAQLDEEFAKVAPESEAYRVYRRRRIDLLSRVETAR